MPCILLCSNRAHPQSDFVCASFSLSAASSQLMNGISLILKLQDNTFAYYCKRWPTFRKLRCIDPLECSDWWATEHLHSELYSGRFSFAIWDPAIELETLSFTKTPIKKEEGVAIAHRQCHLGSRQCGNMCLYPLLSQRKSIAPSRYADLVRQQHDRTRVFEPYWRVSEKYPFFQFPVWMKMGSRHCPYEQ